MEYFLSLFSADNIVETVWTLFMLILLQAVLGFDNLLYISIEARRVAPEHQSNTRRWGIGLAIFFRIALLFIVLGALEFFKETKFAFEYAPIIKFELTVHSIVLLAGGIFIIYTAVKEIFHMLMVEDLEGPKSKNPRSVPVALFWIITINLIFSFDSILAAKALTDHIPIMVIAIVISGVLMIWLSDRIADFLKKNRMYEVLGLFILLLVGVLLVSEVGDAKHGSMLVLFNQAIEPMSKSTFYFVLFILVAVDLVQTQYRKKLTAQRKEETGA